MSADKNKKPLERLHGIADHFKWLLLVAVTLAFTGKQQHLEACFQETYFANSLDHVRQCKLYSMIFFGVFGLLDAFVFPEQKFQLWFIRYVLVCPVFLAGLAFSYTKAYRRLWQPINAFYIMMTGIAYWI